MPSELQPQADEELFPHIYQPGKDAGRGCNVLIARVPSLKYLSISLFVLLKENDVRLIGLKSLGPV
jgi:hypothetical protein